MPYRNRRAGLEVRVHSARAEIRRLEARIAPEVFDYLDATRRAALFAGRARAAPAIDASVATSAGADETVLEVWARDIEAYVALLGTLNDDVREIEASALRPSDAPPPLTVRRTPVTFQPPAPAELRAEAETTPIRLGEALARFGSKMDTSTWETDTARLPPWHYRATFRVDGAPFSALFAFEYQGAFLTVSCTFGTTVAPALRPLLVLPRTSFFQRLFRMQSRFGPELATDERFDGVFAARSLDRDTVLTPDVRTKLIALTRWDVPTVTLDRGVATLHYNYDPAMPPIWTAIEALRTIRMASPPVSFLR